MKRIPKDSAPYTERDILPDRSSRLLLRRVEWHERHYLRLRAVVGQLIRSQEWEVLPSRLLV